jgi:hypothetical protein
MKSRVYHCGKPEARDELIGAIDKATASIRNELGSIHAI